MKPQQEKSDPAALPTDGVWRPWRKKETFVYEKFSKATVPANDEKLDLNYFEVNLDH